jgi:predicted molibdopterin-dependent oxidoreductase YjgC
LLQDARCRNVPIVTFNPLRERGLERFVNPQSPVEMLTNASTQISTQYQQVKAGGENAAIAGICKFLSNWTGLVKLRTVERSATRRSLNSMWLVRTISQCRLGIYVGALGESVGLEPQRNRSGSRGICAGDRVMAVYGMGLTQHRARVEALQMVANLLLLRGNIGKWGAGICPVRGHFECSTPAHRGY